MALSIGSLAIRIMPSKGKSISRIGKMAPATESVDATTERMHGSKAMIETRFSSVAELKLPLERTRDGSQRGR
jgi:hypothetical protein